MFNLQTDAVLARAVLSRNQPLSRATITNRAGPGASASMVVESP